MKERERDRLCEFMCILLLIGTTGLNTDEVEPLILCVHRTGVRQKCITDS